jgi:hypothetical protein
MTARTDDQKQVFATFRDALRRLYHGRTPEAVRFQYAVIVVDLAIIAFFISAPVLQNSPSFLWLDYSVAALLCIDTVARAFASRSILRWVIQPTVWVDMFILLTLLMPSVFANLAFLRILRLWSLSRSGFLWRAWARTHCQMARPGARRHQFGDLPLHHNRLCLYILFSIFGWADGVRRCALLHRSYGHNNRVW